MQQIILLELTNKYSVLKNLLEKKIYLMFVILFKLLKNINKKIAPKLLKDKTNNIILQYRTSYSILYTMAG